MDWIVRYMRGNSPDLAFRNNTPATRAMIDKAVQKYTESSKEVYPLFVAMYGSDSNVVNQIQRETRFAARWYADYKRAEKEGQG